MSERELTKTNIPGYYKDEETGFVVNTNHSEYDRFVMQKMQHMEYLKTKEQISSLQAEMIEIKRLLLEKKNNG